MATSFPDCNGWNPPSLAAWLRGANIDTSTLPTFLCGINEAPIDADIKWFFRKNTCEVPKEGGLFLTCYAYEWPEAIKRDDYCNRFAQLARNHDTCFIAAHTGLGTGKTMACVDSLLDARKQVFGSPDTLVVWAAASSCPRLDQLKTVLQICLECKIPIVCDEVLNIDGFARVLKTFAESNHTKIPLTLLWILSSYEDVKEHAVTKLRDMRRFAVEVLLLPSPSLSMIVTLLKKRYQDVEQEEFSKLVLRHLTFSGPNLWEHWPPVVNVQPRDLTDLSLFRSIFNLYLVVSPSTLASTFEGIRGGLKNLLDEPAMAVNKLVQGGYVKPRTVQGKLTYHLYDIVDYRLITMQTVGEYLDPEETEWRIEEAERRVLAEVLRSDEGMMLLAKVLGLKGVHGAANLLAIYGQLGDPWDKQEPMEIDLLLAHMIGGGKYHLYVCSVQRSEESQDLDEGFLVPLAYLGGVPGAQELYKRDLYPDKIASITLVAISCIPSWSQRVDAFECAPATYNLEVQHEVPIETKRVLFSEIIDAMKLKEWAKVHMLKHRAGDT